MNFYYNFLVLFLSHFLRTSLSHKHYDLDTSLTTLCQSSEANKETRNGQKINLIELDDNPDKSSVIIAQKWNTSSYKHFDQCQFTVKTRSRWMHGPSSGLFVSISDLKLRKTSRDECIDYVMLEAPYIEDNYWKSEKICGTVTGDDVYDAKFFFEILHGEVNVIVHIDQQNELNDNEEIGLTLTMTAYEDCNGSYKFRCTSSRCIPLQLVDDHIINCIPPLCGDEPTISQKCLDTKYRKPKSHLLTVVGSSSSILLLVFIIAFGWYCYKLNKSKKIELPPDLLSDSSPSDVNSNLEVRSRYVPSADANSNLEQSIYAGRRADSNLEFQRIYVPSVADATLASSSDEMNPDNPPSYESLFKGNKVTR